MAAQVVRSISLCSWTNEVYILSGTKGQLILKQNCRAVTSPKKRREVMAQQFGFEIY